VGWAKTYLEKAGLLEKPKRAHFRITRRGLEVHAEKPEALNVRYLLDRFPEFAEFKQGKGRSKDPASSNRKDGESEATPEEQLESAFQSLKTELASEIIDTVKKATPVFFERLVVDLLVRMGYGGSRKEAGMALGKSGDEGIDGMIKEDRLGLDVIYVQAKRWDNATVGRPEIQRFAGALQGKRAKKGIFITTSSFSAEAKEYVNVIDTKIILIDGEQLADLMIDHNVGVTPIASYEVKRLDSDYFYEG
jgi:restriction system protein